MRFASLSGRLVLLAGGPGGDGAWALDVGRASAGELPADPLAALARWSEVRDWAAGADVEGRAERVDVRALGAPVPQPRQVFAVALNYRPHAAEAGFAAPDQPLVFTKYPSCITGPHTQVRLPPGRVDWEIEVVAVIGHGGRDLTEDDAWAAVAGLAIGQDLSERDLQSAGTPAQFSLGKSHAGFGPVGPATTPDAVADPDDVGFTCSLDGETVQSGRTSEMIFTVPDLVARLSRVVELLPGDLVFTGTPAGVGNRRTPPRFLRPGETLVSSAEGLGEIQQTFTSA